MQKYSQLMGYSQDFIEKLKRFNTFSVLYVPKWHQANNAAEVQKVDLEFHAIMEAYRSIDEDVACAVLEKLSRHLEFLAPEYSFLSLTSKKISDEEKKSIAAAIFSHPAPQQLPPAPLKPLVPINGSTELQHLANSERSHLAFLLLGVSVEFLREDPEEWPNYASFQRLVEFVKNYQLVNDNAEHAVQLATDYNEKVTKNETQRQYLYHTVEQQRRERSDFRRHSLQPNMAPAEPSGLRRSLRLR